MDVGEGVQSYVCRQLMYAKNCSSPSFVPTATRSFLFEIASRELSLGRPPRSTLGPTATLTSCEFERTSWIHCGQLGVHMKQLTSTSISSPSVEDAAALLSLSTASAPNELEPNMSSARQEEQVAGECEEGSDFESGGRTNRPR